ncbi:alpha/beta hydrolase [Streptomyces sp. NPDC048111]|uniref:alpha/beta hydrolase n=1 Tax=Streptomyces sp. NPDC048111 TaxID=3365500 RepID=UPI003711A4A1
MKPTPVVFIHGLWLNTSSWTAWMDHFDTLGFRVRAPAWPGEVAAGREPDLVSREFDAVGMDVLTAHYAAIVRSLEPAPVIIGHSVGGLVAQQLITTGLGRAAVAIAPAPANGVALPALSAPPADRPAGFPARLSSARFHAVVANTAQQRESDLLYERCAMAAPAHLLRDLGHHGAHTTVDVAAARRGPLLLVSGQEDRLVPDAVTRAVYKQYGDTTAVTDLKQFADRAHSLVFDSGWRLVADHVLGWLAAQGVRARTPRVP